MQSTKYLQSSNSWLTNSKLISSSSSVCQKYFPDRATSLFSVGLLYKYTFFAWQFCPSISHHSGVGVKCQSVRTVPAEGGIIPLWFAVELISSPWSMKPLEPPITLPRWLTIPGFTLYPLRGLDVTCARRRRITHYSSAVSAVCLN